MNKKIFPARADIDFTETTPYEEGFSKYFETMMKKDVFKSEKIRKKVYRDKHEKGMKWSSIVIHLIIGIIIAELVHRYVFSLVFNQSGGEFLITLGLDIGIILLWFYIVDFLKNIAPKELDYNEFIKKRIIIKCFRFFGQFSYKEVNQNL